MRRQGNEVLDDLGSADEGGGGAEDDPAGGGADDDRPDGDGAEDQEGTGQDGDDEARGHGEGGGGDGRRAAGLKGSLLRVPSLPDGLATVWQPAGQGASTLTRLGPSRVVNVTGACAAVRVGCADK